MGFYYDATPDDYNEKFSEYSDLSDAEVVNEVIGLLESNSYVENDFTETVRGIIRYYNSYNKLSEKQKGILIKHLKSRVVAVRYDN